MVPKVTDNLYKWSLKLKSLLLTKLHKLMEIMFENMMTLITHGQTHSVNNKIVKTNIITHKI